MQIPRSFCSLLICSLLSWSAPFALQAIRAQNSLAQEATAPIFDPKLFHSPIPTKYPETDLPDQLRQQGRGARCAFSVVVDEKGEPQNIRLIRCTDPIFAPNAIRSARMLRFKPATTIADNKVAPVTINVGINSMIGLPDGVDKILPPAKVRAEFVTMPDSESVGPDNKGIYSLTQSFGTLGSFPKLKNFPDRSFAARAFDLEDGVGCTLALTINQSGKVSDAKLVKCDRPSLEKAAIESISKAQFSPATVNGKAVPVRALVHLVCDGFEVPYRQPQ
jgi:TonB family protein